MDAESPKKKKFVWVIPSVLLILSLVTVVAMLGVAHVELKSEVASEADWVRVYKIMVAVESDNDQTAIGDRNLQNKAFGLLQIHKPYLTDALEWAKWNRDNCEHASRLLLWDRYYNGLQPQDLLVSPDILHYTVYRCYMARYMNTDRVGRVPTYAEIIRAHNGGGPRFGKEDWEESTQPHINRTRFLIALGN